MQMFASLYNMPAKHTELSLVRRLFGAVLTVAGGFLIGYAQGLITISTNMGEIIAVQSSASPQVGAIVGDYVAGFVQQAIDPNYGSYWVFGVIMAIFGLLLISWWEKRAKRPPPPPLLQPVPTKQPEL